MVSPSSRYAILTSRCSRCQILSEVDFCCEAENLLTSLKLAETPLKQLHGISVLVQVIDIMKNSQTRTATVGRDGPA